VDHAYYPKSVNLFVGKSHLFGYATGQPGYPTLMTRGMRVYVTAKAGEDLNGAVKHPPQLFWLLLKQDGFLLKSGTRT
jgi:hypothetical protein